METPFDGFSIRDYTNKMRSIDVFKCWPFSTATPNNVTAREVQSWLPPMTLPKFRRMSNDLETLRSNHEDDSAKLKPENLPSEDEVSTADDRESVKSEKSAAGEEEKLEMVCPVCRDFNAATLTAVNAHIDGCLAQTMREERRHMRIMSLKSKSKAPKKRSIAEIFKVKEQQPKIETVLKLWPFREDNPDEVSITVTKFRWLSRRLEALRSEGGDREISRKGDESVKSDEGDSAVEEKLEMICPVCRDFNAATVTAVNAHIDGCLAQAMREERRQMKRKSSKSKPKATKKRSIAEILTVAPPIEARNSKVFEAEDVYKEEEDEGNGEEEVSDYVGGDSSGAADAALVSTIKSNKSTNMNKKKKKMKKGKKKSKLEKRRCSGGVVSLNDGKKMMVSKKKKKKKTNFIIQSTAKKEDASKRKVQTPVNSSRKLKGKAGYKMVALDDIDASVSTKKLSLKILSVENKQKGKICDLVGKQQKAVSPVCGILKNHFKHVPERTSSGSDVPDGTEKLYCDDQVTTSDRHVKFSDEDDILGPEKRFSFDETAFNLSSDALATSLVKEQYSGSEEESESLEGNINYDHITANIDKREEGCPIVESKQFSNCWEQGSVQNILKPCTYQEKSKHLVEKTEPFTKVPFCDNDNNNNNDLHLFGGCDTTTLHCSPYANISRPLSALQAAQMSGRAFSSSGKCIDPLDDQAFQVTANSNANARTFLEPSSSGSTSYNKANERPEFSFETYGDNDNSGQDLNDRQLSHMFSLDMVDNSLPFPGWGKGSVRNNCLDQNFFGLPLNSQGELINFSSSGKVVINQPEPTSLLGSVSSLPVNNIPHQGSQDNFSMNERHVVQKTFPKDVLNPFPHYPVRLVVAELQGEKADFHQPNSDMCCSHYVQPLNSEMKLLRNPFINRNQHDQVQNYNGNEMNSLKESSDLISPCSGQPTVRLMGKDVPIGRSSKNMQKFAGDVWDDEESRRRHNSEYSALDNSPLGRGSKQDSISGPSFQLSSENVLQSVKIQSNQASESTLLINGQDTEFPQLYPQTCQASQHGSHVVSRNVSSYFRPVTQAPTSHAVLNGARDDYPVKLIPGAKPLGGESQVLSPHCNFGQPNCLSNGELNERSKRPHATKSAFGFPFLHPVVDEHAKSTWFQRPYGSFPSWLSSSTDERLPGTFSQRFSGISSRSFPQNTWRNNFTTPSMNHSSEVLYPPNPLTSHHPMKAPLRPASSVQPPQVSVTPPTINNGGGNVIRVTDRVKLADMTTKGHHPCANTRKRPAANFEDSRKSIKLPNTEVQESLSHMTVLNGENFSAELQRNTRAVQQDAQSSCCQNEAQNLNPRSYPAVVSFKRDGKVTLGPIRQSKR